MINAVKNVAVTASNAAAAVVFAAFADLNWAVVALIALGSVLGGQVGAHLGRRLPDPVLRVLVVVLGGVRRRPTRTQLTPADAAHSALAAVPDAEPLPVLVEPSHFLGSGTGRRGCPRGRRQLASASQSLGPGRRSVTIVSDRFRVLATLDRSVLVDAVDGSVTTRGHYRSVTSCRVGGF